MLVGLHLSLPSRRILSSLAEGLPSGQAEVLLASHCCVWAIFAYLPGRTKMKLKVAARLCGAMRYLAVNNNQRVIVSEA